ncbi:MAG: hypothetical protein PWP48_2078 [Clostridiales bacterium]|nr:hypothetical protein [Clostridiales bacterium]MDK2992845.1 hypothetical protein [Clostridiales bacterium]
MNIREIAGDDELVGILELLKELDSEANISFETAKNIWEMMRVYPYYRIFAVFDDTDNIIATFTLIICENLGHGGKAYAVVENVVVRSEYRGMGIGRAMMDKAIQISKERKCYKLMLSSDIKREGAHRFYENLGFARHGISYRVEL